MEKVRDKEIVVDAQLFDEVLKLPLLKFEIDGFKNNSTTPQTYFKTWLKVGKGKWPQNDKVDACARSLHWNCIWLTWRLVNHIW